LKKVLITGADGFLGNHLTNHLINKKFNVIELSDQVKKKSTMNRIHGDIRSINKLPEKISHIIHFAAMADVEYCKNHPKDCLEINVIGTQNMLELVRKNNSKFIFASTSHIFGSPKKLPISEDDDLHPQSIYAASKACCELICKTYSELYGLDIIILRLFSIYGPNCPQYSIVNKVISQILQENKIKIGNVHPKRDFLYVDDFVTAIELLMEKNVKGFLKYNIGYGESTSIYDLCNKLIKISGKPIQILQDKKLIREKEIPDLKCDISKIQELGWKPNVRLDEGLQKTFDWFKKH